jgi:signal peptidase II
MRVNIFYKIIFSWIILDLFSKIVAKIYLQEPVNILWNFFYLGYIENTGIAFSIAIPSTFLKIITIILIFLIFCYYLKEEKQKKNILVDVSFWLILSWAIGNGIERVFRWYVIDFIGIEYFSVFNLADSFITIGAVIYLYYLYKNKTCPSDQKN